MDRVPALKKNHGTNFEGDGGIERVISPVEAQLTPHISGKPPIKRSNPVVGASLNFIGGAIHWAWTLSSYIKNEARIDDLKERVALLDQFIGGKSIFTFEGKEYWTIVKTLEKGGFEVPKFRQHNGVHYDNYAKLEQFKDYKDKQKTFIDGVRQNVHSELSEYRRNLRSAIAGSALAAFSFFVVDFDKKYALPDGTFLSPTTISIYDRLENKIVDGIFEAVLGGITGFSVGTYIHYDQSTKEGFFTLVTKDQDVCYYIFPSHLREAGVRPLNGMSFIDNKVIKGEPEGCRVAMKSLNIKYGAN